MFQPPTVPPPIIAPLPAPAVVLPTVQTISENPLLVPSTAPTRPAVPLDEFSARYSFSDNIRNMLQGEGFTSSNQLRLISLQELREMGLKRGEIAVLQEAAGIHWEST